MKDLTPLIQAYIDNWDYINNLEIYKWEAVKFFQSVFFTEGESITKRTMRALSKHVNLLDTQKYFPLGVINDMNKSKPKVAD